MALSRLLDSLAGLTNTFTMSQAQKDDQSPLLHSKTSGDEPASEPLLNPASTDDAALRDMQECASRPTAPRADPVTGMTMRESHNMEDHNMEDHQAGDGAASIAARPASSSSIYDQIQAQARAQELEDVDKAIAASLAPDSAQPINPGIRYDDGTSPSNPFVPYRRRG